MFVLFLPALITWIEKKKYIYICERIPVFYELNCDIFVYAIYTSKSHICFIYQTFLVVISIFVWFESLNFDIPFRFSNYTIFHYCMNRANIHFTRTYCHPKILTSPATRLELLSSVQMGMSQHEVPFLIQKLP